MESTASKLDQYIRTLLMDIKYSLTVSEVTHVDAIKSAIIDNPDVVSSTMTMSKIRNPSVLVIWRWQNKRCKGQDDTSQTDQLQK
jgi:NACalpha-BTF3-like transcription factor